MQIVIDIPESLYNAINQDIYINGMRSGKTILQKLVNAIAHGTVLLKHGRLKDVDEYFKINWEHPDYDLGDDAPTILEAYNGE